MRRVDARWPVDPPNAPPARDVKRPLTPGNHKRRRVAKELRRGAPAQRGMLEMPLQHRGSPIHDKRSQRIDLLVEVDKVQEIAAFVRGGHRGVKVAVRDG